jgi:thymidylate kinase
MIVEFIGSTGAGKTTLINQILTRSASEGINAVVGADFVLKRSRLDGVKNPLLRTVLVNLIAPVAALAAWRTNLGFYRFTLQTVLKLPGAVPPLERLGLAKNILKRIGIFEMIRRQGTDQQLYLVDEGTLHVAHSLFVHVAGAANHHDLATFASLAPLPHVVVYVRQAETVLVERTLARGHVRVPDHSVATVTQFVRQAVQVFDELVQYPAIAKRLVMVDSAEQRVTASVYSHDPVAARVAQLIQAGLETSAAKVSV